MDYPTLPALPPPPLPSSFPNSLLRPPNCPIHFQLGGRWRTTAADGHSPPSPPPTSFASAHNRFILIHPPPKRFSADRWSVTSLYQLVPKMWMDPSGMTPMCPLPLKGGPVPRLLFRSLRPSIRRPFPSFLLSSIHSSVPKSSAVLSSAPLPTPPFIPPPSLLNHPPFLLVHGTIPLLRICFGHPKTISGMTNQLFPSYRPNRWIAPFDLIESGSFAEFGV